MSSIIGGQLPLTAFFGSRPPKQPQQSGKAKEPAATTKRKVSPGRARDTQPPKKKQRQKENVTPRASGSRRRGDALSPISDVVDSEGDGKPAKGSSAQAAMGGADGDDSVVNPTYSPPATYLDLSSPLSSPPATPPGPVRIHRPLAAASLPSPPLTAPAAKRIKRNRSEEDITTRLDMSPVREDRRPTDINRHGSGSATAQVVGNKDVIVLRPPQTDRHESMPPPPLPLRANSATMPMRPVLRSQWSSSSDKWVPSSQTQELSIPRPEKDPSRSIPYTPVEQISQVVPSSQSNERELRISDALPPASDIHKTPISPLRPNCSPVSPLFPTSGEDHVALDADVGPGLPPPDLVQSSQSQYEHEISSSWAEMMGARRAAMSRGGLDELASIPSSSPSRPTESQDYDAHDECSQSQDMHSQPSTFASSHSYTSPLRATSQYTDASSSSSVVPYPITPSQVRGFVDMFKNRDEFGNELPADDDNEDGNGRSRSVSPSPTSRRRPRPETSRGRPANSYAEHSPTSRRSDSGEGRDLLDELTASQLDVPEGGVHDLDPGYGSSDGPSQCPSAVLDFLEMFDRDSQPSQASTS